MIVIIHFLPIEEYPPIMNFLNCMCGILKKERVTVFTTKCKEKIPLYQNNSVDIIRFYPITASISRYLFYFVFYFGTIFRLLFLKPSKILWYETLSSFPAIVYYFLKRKKPRLYIHYHEYTSPEEIEKGMTLVRWFHTFEQRIYPKVEWLSINNEFRMELLLKDNVSIKPETTRILPNYPPHRWCEHLKKREKISFPVKLVYIGTFASFDTLYIKELVDWMSQHQNEISLAVYSFRVPEEIKKYCEINKDIKIYGPIEYCAIPQIVSQYDIGLVLYKGGIPNCVYSTSNKLFEYWYCGLDVWFPQPVKGCYPYITDSVYPKVIKVDFDNLDNIDIHEIISRRNLIYSPSKYFAEDVYMELIDQLL